MGTSRSISLRQLSRRESMNHVLMDMEDDDQALVKNVGLKCPRCESTNTKFDFYQNQKKSQPRYYCKDCERGWSVNGKLRDIPPVSEEAERKIRQPDVSASDHTHKGLKCPCCESTNTKFAYHQNQIKSKPIHFCNDCLYYWAVPVAVAEAEGDTVSASPGEKKRQQPETSVADQAPMPEMELDVKCPRCGSIETKFVRYQIQIESNAAVYFCENCRRHWTVGGLLRKKLYSGGKRIKRRRKGSGLKASMEGPDSQSASKETTETGRTEGTELSMPSEEEPQHLSLRLLESDNDIVKDNGGEWKGRQPVLSMADQVSMPQVALKCPRCESTDTNFYHQSIQNKPKPVYFCKNCRRCWTVGGSLRTKQQRKDLCLQASVEGPESHAASIETKF